MESIDNCCLCRSARRICLDRTVAAAGRHQPPQNQTSQQRETDLNFSMRANISCWETCGYFFCNLIACIVAFTGVASARVLGKVIRLESEPVRLGNRPRGGDELPFDQFELPELLLRECKLPNSPTVSPAAASASLAGPAAASVLRRDNHRACTFSGGVYENGCGMVACG